MARQPDTPCCRCGELMWSGSTSLPAGERTCQPCRRIAREAKPQRIRDCLTCSTLIVGDYRKRYCSPECRPARNRGTTSCAWCAAVFVRRHGPDQRCCSKACGVRLRTQGQVSVIPWASCLHCRSPFIARLGRRHCPKQMCTLYLRGVHSPPGPTAATCRQCGEVFTYQHVTRPRDYCSSSCRRASPATKQGRRNAKARRRARLKGATTERINAVEVFERDHWICHLCRRLTLRSQAVPHPRAPTLDHLVPLAHGGSHTLANVACACFDCNCRKGDRALPNGDQLRLWG